jgi:hypothetical protein
LTAPTRVADLTYVPVVGGFAYVAVILDAWSRRVVGYSISRSIDARLALAALSIPLEAKEESRRLLGSRASGGNHDGQLYPQRYLRWMASRRSPIEQPARRQAAVS